MRECSRELGGPSKRIRKGYHFLSEEESVGACSERGQVK